MAAVFRRRDFGVLVALVLVGIVATTLQFGEPWVILLGNTEGRARRGPCPPKMPRLSDDSKVAAAADSSGSIGSAVVTVSPPPTVKAQEVPLMLAAHNLLVKPMHFQRALERPDSHRHGLPADDDTQSASAASGAAPSTNELDPSWTWMVSGPIITSDEGKIVFYLFSYLPLEEEDMERLKTGLSFTCKILLGNLTQVAWPSNTTTGRGLPGTTLPALSDDALLAKIHAEVAPKMQSGKAAGTRTKTGTKRRRALYDDISVIALTKYTQTAAVYLDPDSPEGKVLRAGASTCNRRSDPACKLKRLQGVDIKVSCRVPTTQWWAARLAISVAQNQRQGTVASSWARQYTFPLFVSVRGTFDFEPRQLIIPPDLERRECYELSHGQVEHPEPVLIQHTPQDNTCFGAPLSGPPALTPAEIIASPEKLRDALEQYKRFSWPQQSVALSVCMGKWFLPSVAPVVTKRGRGKTVRNEPIQQGLRRLIEYIEHHRHLGVGHFTIYVKKVPEDLDLLRLMAYYAAQGLVTWVDFTLEDVSRPPELFDYNQQLSLDDCLERQRRQSTYTLISDTDELVVITAKDEQTGSPLMERPGSLVDIVRAVDLSISKESRIPMGYEDKRQDTTSKRRPGLMGSIHMFQTWLMTDVCGPSDIASKPLLNRNLLLAPSIPYGTSALKGGKSIIRVERYKFYKVHEGDHDRSLCLNTNGCTDVHPDSTQMLLAHMKPSMFRDPHDCLSTSSPTVIERLNVLRKTIGLQQSANVTLMANELFSTGYVDMMQLAVLRAWNDATSILP